MKAKISIQATILMLLFTTGSFAQYNMKEMYVLNANQKLLKMPFASSGGEKGITIFEYDKNGKLESSVWKLLDVSRSSNNFYTYNEQGNIIKKFREFSDEITSTELFTYDSKNRLLTEEFNRSDGFTYKTFYTYDEQDKVETIRLENYHGWLSGEIQFEYQKNNQVKTGNIFRDGKQIGVIEFAYDDKGLLKSEHWEFNGSYSQTFTFEYEHPMVYSSSNVFITNTHKYQIISEDYNFNQESGGPSIYFYSNDGKLEKKIFKVDGKLKTTTKYFYDSEGLLTHSIRTLVDGKENIFRYKYNKDRQLTDRINYLNDSIIGQEHYTYQNGLLVGGEYKNFDYWLNGSLSFKHDENGFLETGFFKGKDGFNAQIVFTTNEDGNITKVHWEFSFGKTQTYEFEYEKLPLVH